jgi:hypothetical protein
VRFLHGRSTNTLSIIRQGMFLSHITLQRGLQNYAEAAKEKGGPNPGRIGVGIGTSRTLVSHHEAGIQTSELNKLPAIAKPGLIVAKLFEEGQTS